MRQTFLTDVHIGETFTLDDVEFIKLDEDKNVVFAMALNPISSKMPFKRVLSGAYEKPGDNNFVGSDMQLSVDDWVTDHSEIANAIKKRSIDLISISGKSGYGNPDVAGRILTISEYVAYRTLIPSYAESYWLATPGPSHSCPTLSTVICVDGTVSHKLSSDKEGVCIPTLYLDPHTTVLIASDDHDRSYDRKQVLKGFSDAELFEELLNRLQKI